MKTKIALIVALVALAGTALYFNTNVSAQPAPAAGQADDQHLLIRRAMHALGLAQADLKMAKHDFGGHPAAALKACDQALAECKLAMSYDKK